VSNENIPHQQTEICLLPVKFSSLPVNLTKKCTFVVVLPLPPVIKVENLGHFRLRLA